LLIDAYASRLRLAGYRPSSVEARVSCLQSFVRFLAPKPIAEATRLDVESYLGRPLAAESRRAYRGHLKGFFAFALDEGYIASDPTTKLPPVRVPRGQPRPISAEDLRTALANADGRMRAWLLLMSLAGLRCIEVAALRPQDLTVTECGPLLYLRECKGGGTATVPAHQAIASSLLALPVRNGTWWDVTAKRVSSVISAYFHDCGINATAHQLRHWAGTEWYRVSGHDLLTTAQLLRHATVATTQIYAALDPTRPAQVVSQMSCMPATTAPVLDLTIPAQRDSLASLARQLEAMADASTAAATSSAAACP
jgi:integrase/recombinase XerD